MQDEITFARASIFGFSNLYAIKTNTGKYFFWDKDSYRILSGLDNESVKSTLHRYYKRHYDGKDFPSVLEAPSDSEHICTFVDPISGKLLKAFSIAGLEFLCNHITGRNAEANKPRFLNFIKAFRSSITVPQDQPPQGAFGGGVVEKMDFALLLL